MSDLTREQVEAFTNGQREPISNECDLATQLLATMDALTTAETERGKALKVWAEQVKRAEKATERANIAEARNEAALVLSDVGAEGEKRGERVGPQFAECISAILRGEHDE
jgi:hypothetical protein